MTTITLKNIPDDLYERLKSQAQAHRRSVNSELIHCLETVLRPKKITTDAADGVAHGRIQFIAVGTPPGEDGSADLQHVLAAARSIGRHMHGYKVVVTKSTVPVGTADKVRAAIGRADAAYRLDRDPVTPGHPHGILGRGVRGAMDGEDRLGADSA